MAGFAILGDAEGRVSIMTGATRFAVLHRFHACLGIFARCRFENVSVTITAAEHAGVNLVTEEYVTCILFRNRDLPSWMAAAAVVGDAEGGVSVMAGAAGFPFTHGVHAGFGVFACRWFVDVRVALIATEHAGVDIVAEEGRAGRLDLKGDLPGRVATATVVGDAKGGVSVMAGAAGFSFTHGVHGDFWVLSRCRFIDVGVAFAATEHAGVNIMAEEGRAGRFNINGNVTGRVTAAAIVIDREGFVAVMTGTARFAIFHLGHGENRVFFGHDIEDPVVAGRTVLSHRVDMIVVTELNSPGRIDRHHHLILNPTGIKGGWEGGDEQDKQNKTQSHADLLKK